MENNIAKEQFNIIEEAKKSADIDQRGYRA